MICENCQHSTERQFGCNQKPLWESACSMFKKYTPPTLKPCTGCKYDPSTHGCIWSICNHPNANEILKEEPPIKTDKFGFPLCYEKATNTIGVRA